MEIRQIRRWTLSLHVVILQRIKKKRTKIYNARAQPLFCSLNLFGDVLASNEDVVCSSSLTESKTRFNKQNNSCALYICIFLCRPLQNKNVDSPHGERKGGEGGRGGEGESSPKFWVEVCDPNLVPYFTLKSVIFKPCPCARDNEHVVDTSKLGVVNTWKGLQMYQC